MLCAPVAAAAAQLDIIEADVFDLEGRPLARVAVQQTVQFMATVTNVGDTDHSGPAPIVFRTTEKDLGYNDTKIVTVNITLAKGAKTNVTLEWTPPELGNYTLEVSVEGVPTSKFTLTGIEVAKTAVVRSSALDRVIDYAWVYAAFLAAVILYLLVARIRKAR